MFEFLTPKIFEIKENDQWLVCKAVWTQDYT